MSDHHAIQPAADPAPPDAWEPGSGRRTAPEAVWDQVREDYLSGLSAPACCRRHGVGLSALRKRAADEGWRRADQPWIPPVRLDPDDEGVALEVQVDGDLDKVEMSDLAYVAHRRMMRAVVRGDAAEALRWRRVRLVMDDEQAEVDRWIAEEEAFAACLRDANAVDASDASDASDGVFDRAEGPSGRP